MHDIMPVSSLTCYHTSQYDMKCFFVSIFKLKEKLWMNPQYFVKLTDPDETDDVDTCTLIVSLMQKFRRKMRTQMKTTQYLNLAIGFKIYKVSIRHH